MPYKLITRTTIQEPLLEAAKSNNVWTQYHMFKAMPVPHRILDLDPFFRKLPVFKAGILKMDPHTCYDWHVDGKREGAINMLLTGFDSSLCLFKNSNGEVYFKTKELPYEEGALFAFNTQTPHTVVNNEGDRYLFSIEFLEPVPYEKLVEILK